MPERVPSPAVYGIETEYSCMLRFPGDVVEEIVGSCHSPDTKLGLYVQPKKKGSDHIGDGAMNQALFQLGIERTDWGMLSNGGRLYTDPSGPEYATPETRTAAGAVHRSFDGDEILYGVFNHLRGKGALEGFQINRRIVDHNRSSRGIHLNTTTSLPTEPDFLTVNYLATLNVAKGSMFGSGGLLLDSQGRTAFYHSPRLALTNCLSAEYAAYTKRPLVRYPFKPDGELSRIETVTSDALNFAWPLRASMVLTKALTDVIELGYGGRLPLLRDPERAANTVGKHGYNCHVAVHSGNSFKGVRPLDLIRQICELVLEVDDEYEGHLDQESRQVIPEIIEIADTMAKDPFSVAGVVESVARYVTMKRKMEEKGFKWDSEAMCRLDYAWDWIGGGIAEGLRKGTKKVGWDGFRQGYSALDTKKWLAVAPTNTRAHLRGALILEGKSQNASDWHNFDFNDGCGASTYVHPLTTDVDRSVLRDESAVEDPIGDPF